MKRFFPALIGALLLSTTVFARVNVPLTVTETGGVSRTGETVRSGVPFTKGAVKSTDELILTDADGTKVPTQFDTLSSWPDGSVRWALLNFSGSAEKNGTVKYTLKTKGKRDQAPEVQAVSISDNDDVFTVSTGSVSFDVPIYSRSIISNIRRKTSSGSWKTVSTNGIEAVIWRTGVKKFISRVENCTIESAGPLATVVKIEGHHFLWDHTIDQFDPGDIPTFKFVARVFCFAGSNEIKLQYTFINDNRDNIIRPSERYHVYAMEELADYMWVNGHWVERPKSIKFREQELLKDDYGQINVKDIRLSLALDEEYTDYAFGVVDGEPAQGKIDGPVALEQLGPEHSYDYYHKDMPYPRMPFQAMVLHGKGAPRQQFEKAEGWASMHGDNGSVFLGSKYFWQYHPKVIALDKKTLEFHLWNKLEDIPDPEIGFAKTHEIVLRFAENDEKFKSDEIMAGINAPLMAVAPSLHYMSTGVFGSYLAANDDMWADAEDYLLTSAENTARDREKRHIYGVRNFGDFPGIRYVPIYYNQEYDTLLGSMLQYARTGERIFLDESDIYAWHFMDVDVLHASNSPLNEGAQHMHFTDHAKGETHAGHCTVEGLWYYYMMTGEPRAKDVAVGIADYQAKIAAWKDFLDFRDDEERTIGWALKGLVPSYRHTLNPRYKLAAQMIVEQAIAGQDKITGNWDHPLYPNEDKHRPVCVGGKPWMVGIILQGMKHYHREFGDPRVKELILKAADWMIWSDYAYMTCSDRKPGQPGTTHLDGLSYAWELSGKRYYLDEALRGFHLSIASWTKEKARSSTLRGNSVEGLMNVMRIVEEQGSKVWRDGAPVYDPKSAKITEEMRANPKFQAKRQKRY